MIFSILLAAGKSSRFCGDEQADIGVDIGIVADWQQLPKPYVSLSGQQIIKYSLTNLSRLSDHVVCVIANGDEKYLRESMRHVCYGGESRAQSVSNAINYIKANFAITDADIVLIHDAARPLVPIIDINKLLAYVQKQGLPATLAIKVNDTLAKVDQNLYLENNISRNGVWRLITPQAFNLAKLSHCYNKTKQVSDFTDDISLYLSCYGELAKVIESTHHGMKITYQHDLKFLEQLIGNVGLSANNTITKTTQGFDVHKLIAGDGVVIGGIKIPSQYMLEGHSDADVLLHALTDAILAAANAGDIGDNFPPSDEKWRGANSEIFLNFALDKLKHNNLMLNNVDITIMAETPKIGQYKQQIATHLAMLCQLPVNMVSVKATTTEKLGFVGRQEGVAVSAIITTQQRGLI
jgi:2-C-methyl-D-erythritol 4-phosphate cytidylyltransferase/2-C-methyl-D-erythritol 2,4-cyclodiphosphate synthase